MLWKLIKSLPKVALVLGVLLASTGMFAWWWYFHSPVRREENRVWQEHKQEEVRKTVAEVDTRMGHLLLIDDDLFDLDAGRVFFQHWLSGGVPKQLYFDAETKKLIAFYGGGFVRYALDGTKETALARQYPMVFSDDLKTAWFCKDKDIWRADLDWQGWKLINEKQLTTIGQFSDPYFVGNIFFRTDKTLVMRGTNKLLRVSLETGDVHPTKLPFIKSRKQRSPDNKSLVGAGRKEFYCYDLGSEVSKTLPLGGRGFMDDYQWLDNDRCLCLQGTKALMLYDRVKNTLEELLPLPSTCLKIGEFSPDKRFVFCTNRKALMLVDLERKTAVPVSGGQGLSWVSNDTFAFSREVPDSALRGTWLQTAGGAERRVSPEPFVVRDRVKPLLLVKSAGLVVFITKQGVMRMKPDGRDLAPVLKVTALPGRLVQLPSHLTDIGDWKAKRGGGDDDDDTEPDQ